MMTIKTPNQLSAIPTMPSQEWKMQQKAILCVYVYEIKRYAKGHHNFICSLI